MPPSGLAILRHWFYKDSAPDGAKDDERDSRRGFHPVFLSHSSKDKAVVRAVAERLRADGLRVWLDDWETRPGDSIPAKIAEGPEHSHVLACTAEAPERGRMLCMSTNALGSDLTQVGSPHV